MAAVAAALAEPQLAERQREVVGDDEQVGQRGVVAGEHLADGQARLVHVRQRLHERQVEAAVAAPDDGGGVALAATAGPAGTIRQAVHDHPADVVPGPRVLRPGVPEADDELHRTLRRQPNRARSRPGGPARMVAPGRYRRVRRAGGVAVSRARIAASSSGSAWSQPQRWSVPWVTRRRSSSAADQRDVAGLAAAAGLPPARPPARRR